MLDPVTSGLAGKSADLSSTNSTADNNESSTKLSKLPDEIYSNKSSRTNRLSDSGYTV